MNHIEGSVGIGSVFTRNENGQNDVAVFQLIDHGFDAFAVRELDLVAVQRVLFGRFMFALFVRDDVDDLAVGDADRGGCSGRSLPLLRESGTRCQ